MDEPLLLVLTTAATETMRPARLCSKAASHFLFAAMEIDEPGQRQAGLDLYPIHGYGRHAWYMCASLAGTCLQTEHAAQSSGQLPG